MLWHIGDMETGGQVHKSLCMHKASLSAREDEELGKIESVDEYHHEHLEWIKVNHERRRM
ncbi:hypothetical protein DM860_016393 [Cuscuta australis]|uniref:Uncharacterized protein n=1 Tax=Cuscuta australis TaxID=267555 RepID=A0A328DEH8_9ASTE|nr:hypothetical protein DM860_016393 [Cuscuta australis]